LRIHAKSGCSSAVWKQAGDLPRITANAKGVAEGGFTITGLTIRDSNPIDTKAITIHAGKKRIACGVVRLISDEVSPAADVAEPHAEPHEEKGR
jgi:hypothetical protein